MEEPPAAGRQGAGPCELPEGLLLAVLCAAGAPGSARLTGSCRAVGAALGRATALAPEQLGCDREELEGLLARVSGGLPRVAHFLWRRRTATPSRLSAYRHVAACGPEGSLFSFGSNPSGQLGVGDVSERLSPARVAWAGERQAGVACAAAGGGHTVFADTNGRAWACGLDDGRLGLAEEPVLDCIGVAVPREVAGLRGVRIRAVSCGWSSTLFLAGSGEVFTAREGAGLGLQRLASLPLIVQISAGYAHALALSDTGTLFAWGSNEDGQCGASGAALDMGEVNHPRPVEMRQRHLPGSGKPAIEAISAGGYHSMALSRDGVVLTWGAGRWGQLGRGSRSEAEPEPRPVPGLPGRMGRISAGNLTSLALSASGGLAYGMGRNAEGQLGQGSDERWLSSPARVRWELAVPSGARVVDVCAGRGSSYFVLSDGRVVACGCGYNGRLGTGGRDLIIRGGTIVDGTGAKPYVGDVAVADGKILGVGPNLGLQGKQEYDARGLVVAPGWVDAHTHFDGQVTWDPYLTPSTAGGVTTCIMGNCGVGFAPCQQERREALINLVEAIEDVPGTAVHEGLRWEWETFEGYMDALSRRELACDVAVMIGHSAVRSWVLGDRMNSSDRPGGAVNCPVQKQEVDAMAAVVRDAVAAGAVGFSTSRAIYHRDMAGVLMPGSLASSEEMLALIRAIGEGGGGVFGANMDFRTYDDLPEGQQEVDKIKKHWRSEWTWLDQIASESPGKINMTFEVSSEVADRMKEVEKIMGRHGEKGMLIRTQIHARPQAFLQSIDSKLNMLYLSRTYQKLDKRNSDALLQQMRDPKLRSTIIAEAQQSLDHCLKAAKEGKNSPFMGLVSTLCLDWLSRPPMGGGPFSTIFPWTPGCEPAPEESIRALAKQQGRTPLEVYYDVLVPEQGSELGVAWKPLNNYHEKSTEPMRRVLEHPFSIPGVSDAGAHSGVFNDANGPTHLLTHWVRDRTRGARFPIEFVVAKQTSEIARLFGLTDRGEIRPGLRADLNVIDMDGLKMLKPYVAADLPTGATRWMQYVSGYRLTLVAGQETYRDGQPTGALPGRLVRNPKADASAFRGVAPAVAWRSNGKSSEESGADMEEYALQRAQGGGASAIARIARAAEKEGTHGNLRSRL